MKKQIKNILLLRIATCLPYRVKHPHGHRYPYMLKYMEGLLKRDSNYTIKLIDTLINPMSLGALLDVSLAWDPDMIVIYSTTRDYNTVLEFASSMKRNDGPIILNVGQDATARPESYLFPHSPIDMVIRGDAEVELLNVIHQLNHGRSLEELKDCYFRSKPIHVIELDALPFPDSSLEELRKYYHIYPIRARARLIWGHIISSRGCPYPCMFCTGMIRETTGDKVRLRSAKNVVDEVEYLLKKGVNIFIFDDDNFTTSKVHVENICKEIIRRKLKIKWVAHARVDNLTYNLVKLMKHAGCVLLRFGIESGSNRVLEILEKGHTHNWIVQTKQVFNFCKKLNIGTVALFMIGSPTETKDEIEESIRLAKELDPDIIQVSFFTFYPDTKAIKRIKPEDAGIKFSTMYHFAPPKEELNFSKLDRDTLNKMQKLFYKTTVLNLKYLIKHLVRYGLFYLYNPFVFFSLTQIGWYIGRHDISSGVIKTDRKILNTVIKVF